MAFTFPDPAVTTTVTNPENGITYNYADGMWTPVSQEAKATDLEDLEDEVEDNDAELEALRDATAIDRSLLVNVASRVTTNEDVIDDIQDLDLTNALSALAIARQDIIELKSKVESLELTSFLILE